MEPITRSELINADPTVLWSMVSDVTRMGEWSPENNGAEWVEGADGPALGAKFKGRNKRGRSSWSTTCEVIACEPGKEFAFAVGNKDKPSAVWAYRFAPDPDGAVLVTESCQLPKPLSFGTRLFTRLTTGVKDREADLADGIRQTLTKLKAAAER